MKRALVFVVASATLVVLTFIGSCTKEEKREGAQTLSGAGATFPYPLYSAWAHDYHAKTGVQVNYQSIGSGGGIQQIENRTVDFGASDEPLTGERLNKAQLLQFPSAIGGVVLAINVDGNNSVLKLDANTLCDIFLGTIKTWDDEKIQALNPGTQLPQGAITVVYRSDGSGTTAIFTHYFSETCPQWKTKVGEGKSIRYPVGIGAKGNEGVANVVKRTKNAVGYVEFAYAKQNKLAYAQLKNASGNFVSPSMESFQAAAESADFDAARSFYAWLTNASAANAWPIAGATFILLAKEKPNQRVTAFFEWAFENGDSKARELFYVPLPAPLKKKVREYWKANGL